MPLEETDGARRTNYLAPSWRDHALWGWHGHILSACHMVAVALDLGDPKPRNPGAIDRSAPGAKFFEAQPISLAGVIDA